MPKVTARAAKVPNTVCPPWAPPKITPPAVVDKNQRYNLVESAAVLRISRSELYENIAEGRLKVIRDGRRVFVHGAELIRRSREAVAT